ncbi:hypothetical protein PtA15_1A921 [Puccinia triticina]|uniref:Uncharacterized protein n=1 Tax=Puccinia triticina TaxID=208348 RepID=A0ABY7CA68_9BASI|nr:uncharacterized protein PtA15_1A921 [Puccinia triticina]WAQ81579.1 hypothetical protein PtA15_1A921 [Puccinia triticina]
MFNLQQYGLLPGLLPLYKPATNKELLNGQPLHSAPTDLPLSGFSRKMSLTPPPQQQQIFDGVRVQHKPLDGPHHPLKKSMDNPLCACKLNGIPEALADRGTCNPCPVLTAALEVLARPVQKAKGIWKAYSQLYLNIASVQPPNLIRKVLGMLIAKVDGFVGSL